MSFCPESRWTRGHQESNYFLKGRNVSFFFFNWVISFNMIISRQKCQPCFSPETVQRSKITNNLGIGICTEVGADVVYVHWHLSQTPCVFVDVCVSSLILDRASQILKLDLKRRSLLVFLHLRLWISHSPLAAATVAGLSPLSLVHSFCEEVTTFTHHRMLKSSAVCYFKPRRLGLGWDGGGR